MIAAGRIVVAILILLGAWPALAARISDDGLSNHILIDDPSLALQAQIAADGYRVESVERLEALSLTLMVVAPPRRIATVGALETLRADFP